MWSANSTPDDLGRAEMLELRCIRTGFRGDVNQLDRSIEIPIVVRSDISDEIRRLRFAENTIGDAKFGHFYHL